MSDGTTLDPGVGGDFIVNKVAQANDGLPAGKMPLSALVLLSGAGQDVPTNVKVTAPLPVRLSDGTAFADIGTTLGSILTAILAQATAASIATQAATNHADLAALLTATQALATQATLATASTTLTSILAKIIAGPATEATLAAAKADLDALNATVATAAAQATGNATLTTLSSSLSALVTANHADLGQLHADLGTVNTSVGLLATAAAQTTGNASLASIKTDLDALNANVATAAGQATTHADLGTLSTNLGTINTSLGVLTTANHTDLLSLATALATLHTDSAAILAKQPSAPALEGGNLASAATSVSTIAARTPALGQALAASSSPVVLPAAQDVAALALALQNGGLPSDFMPSGGVGTATAPTLVTDGNAVRSWLTRAGARVAQILGADGSTFASATNGLPVIPATGSLYDVKDRAARLLGALTGINGSGVATGANPVPVQLSDGTAAIALKNAGGYLAVRQLDCTPTGNPWTTAIGMPITTGAVGLLVVPAAAGQYLRSVVIMNPINGTTVNFFLYHGAAPTWGVASGPSIADNTLIGFGTPAANGLNNLTTDLPGGLLVTNGVTIVVSTTNAGTGTTYAAPVSKVYVTIRYGT